MFTLTHQNRENIVEMCTILAQEENLKAAIIENAKGAAVAGLGLFIGGLLGGPVGMAIGGSLASIGVAVNAKGKFKSVVEIIRGMNQQQRKKLAECMKNVLTNIKPEDFVNLAAVVMANPTMKERVLFELGAFLKRELEMQITR